MEVVISQDEGWKKCGYNRKTQTVKLAGFKRGKCAIEAVIETIFEHEILHHTLHTLIGGEASGQLDNIVKWKSNKIIIKCWDD